MGSEGWRRIVRGAGRMPIILLVAVVAAAALIWAACAPQSGALHQPTPLEGRVAQVLSRVDGAGKVQVLIGEGEEGGVLVVAEGADNLGVAIRLSRAVGTLLGVENSRIEVLKMQQGGQ